MNEAENSMEPMQTVHGKQAAWKSLLGLCVVWVALYMVFFAQERSERFSRINVIDSRQLRLERPMIQALDPTVRLLLPLDINQLDTSTRQFFRNVAEIVDFRIEQDDLLKLSDAPHDFRFTSMSVCEVLHAALDNENMGFGVQGRRLRIFEQQVGFVRDIEGQWGMQWQAEIPIGSTPMVIVPSNESGIWFSCERTGTDDESPETWQMMRLNVYDQYQLLASNVIRLDEEGNGKFQTTSQGSGQYFIAFVLNRLQDATDSADAYALKFEYRKYQQAAPMPETQVERESI